MERSTSMQESTETVLFKDKPPMRRGGYLSSIFWKGMILYTDSSLAVTYLVTDDEVEFFIDVTSKDGGVRVLFVLECTEQSPIVQTYRASAIQSQK